MNANTVTTMGIISNEVYDENNIYFTDKEKTLNANNTTYKVLNHTPDTTLSGFNALLLQEIGTSNYVIAFRGTEATSSLSDIVTDILAGTYNINLQYDNAIDFVNEALKIDGISETNLTLTGHSLGGILTQQVGATLGIKGYAYNPWGSNTLAKYSESGTLNIVARLLEIVGVYTPTAETFAKNNILNISYQDSGIINGDILSNFLTGLTSKHLGDLLPIWGENIGLSGHLITPLNNAIKHYNEVLTHFTNSTTLLDLTKVYATSSNMSESGYEKVEYTFNDLNIKNYTDLTFDLLVNQTTSELNSKEVSNLYALQHLNPFAIKGELSAYDNINPNDYSDIYMKDRATFLYEVMNKGNTGDIRAKNHYVDIDDDVEFNGYKNIVTFGSDADDVIEGTDREFEGDRLYGEGGSDTIVGKKGNDYIEGGKGSDELHGGEGQDTIYANANVDKQYDVDNGFTDRLYGDSGDDTLIGSVGKDELYGGLDFDTYIVNNGDTITDSDGKGNIKLDGIDLSGRKTKLPNTDMYEDETYVYEEINGTLVVTKKQDGGTLTINEWSNEELGINLSENNNIEINVSDASALASEGAMVFLISLSRPLDDGEKLSVNVFDETLNFESGDQTKTYTYIIENNISKTFTITPEGTYNGTEDVNVITNQGTGTVIAVKDDDARYDPLALDTSKDGFISTSSLEESNTYFDITGDGLRERVGWIKDEDALLVYDKNENNQIDGINEVFGNLNESGFAELKRLVDSNHDNVINRRDELFARLQIWNDTNQDAKAGENELQSLSEAGIKEIDLNIVETNIEINGNLLSEASKYTDDEGNKELAADIQLATDAKDTKVEIEDIPNFTIDESTKDLPKLHGTGLVYDSFILYNIDEEFKAVAKKMSTNMELTATQFDTFIEGWSGYTGMQKTLQEKYNRILKSNNNLQIKIKEVA